MLCYRYEKNISSWPVYYWFMTTFMPKNNNGLLSIFFAQIRAIWNNWSSVTKNHNIDYFTVYITPQIVRQIGYFFDSKDMLHLIFIPEES